MTNYLEEHGLSLIEGRYKIVPIKRGSKAPMGVSGWTKIDADYNQLQEWVKQGYEGVGVLCKNNPAVDIDVLDSRMLVNSFDAFATTKRLLAEEGIFAGVSSGSVVYGAMRQAERMDKGDIVCLLADGGWKYLSTALWTKDYDELAKEAKGKIWW